MFVDRNYQNNVDQITAGQLTGWGGQRSILAGLEKQRRVLDWIYRWGYSSGTIVTTLSNATRRDYPKRLCERGLLRQVPATRCSLTNRLYCLTDAGLTEARRHTPFDLDYPERDPRKISQAIVYHNLICQREILRILHQQDQRFVGWESDRQFGPNLHETKRPDGVLLDAAHRRTGIEIELSGKWARRLDQFVQRIVGSIHREHFSSYIILVGTEQMRQRYESAFETGTKVKKWAQGPDGKFFCSGETPPIPSSISERVQFSVLEF